MLEKNYSNRILSGCSFENLDLKNANFDNAKIRGVNFFKTDLTNATFNGATINGANFLETDLTNVKFNEAVCGLTVLWTIFIAIISLAIISLSGFTASIIISCNFYFFSNSRSITPFITFLISVIYVTLSQGYYLSQNTWFPLDYVIYTAIGIILLIGAVIPFIITIDEPRSKSKMIFIIVILASLLVVSINISLLIIQPANPLLRRAAGAIPGSLLGILMSYQGIIIKDKKYVWIWNLFVYIASVQGTRFYDCNLENSSFFEANLKGSRFFECKLKRLNWHNVKKIDCSIIQADYINDSRIQELIINKRVMGNKSYSKITLKELNLDNADLIEADLSQSDLSNSTLQHAKLNNSNLSDTKLDNANLNDVEITGTIIEMKSIPSTAKVDGLVCKYFYHKLDPEQRYPLNEKEELTSKEAIKLLQKESQIELDFNQEGIDWLVFLQAFEKTSKYFKITDENLEKVIQSFEKKSDNNFIIELNVPNDISKREFKQKLRDEYKKVIDNLKIEYRSIYFANSANIQNNISMLQIIKQLAYPGVVYIRNLRNTIVNNTGSNTKMTMEESKIDQSGNFGVGVNEGEINTKKVAGNINEAQQKNLVDTAAEIQELLNQLQIQGYSQEQAQQQVAQDLALKADNDPTVLGKLVKWGQSLGDSAAKTTVSEAAKEVFKLALRLSGIPIP